MKKILLAQLLFLCFAHQVFASQGTAADPIIDSALTHHQAIMLNQPPGTPMNILQELEVVNVRYYAFDGKVHQGQVVINKMLVEDIQKVFSVILETKFPVYSVLPIAHPEIQKKGPYGLSSDTNNTSGYVFRKKVKGKTLSMHARGLAIDINPRLNPYINKEKILPADALYEPTRPGTITPQSPLVRIFKELGWTWGGDWTAYKDYMHFQKKLTNYAWFASSPPDLASRLDFSGKL